MNAVQPGRNPKNLTAVSHMRRTPKHVKMLPGSARILRALLIAKP